MGVETGIAWCDHTHNEWIGCTKVSAACDHCYAETLVKRYGWAKWGAGEARHLTSDANRKKPFAWDRKAARDGVRRRVFCSSLADVFDAEVPDRWRLDLMQTIRATPNLDWLLLTKRPQVAKKFFDAQAIPANVWLGTTVEDQKMADLRVPILRSIPAKVRFLSVEPMLGEVTMRPDWMLGLDWIICGGESGAGARVMQDWWATHLREQCQAAGVHFFMKQLGGHPNKRDRLEDLPLHLQVREFPQSAVGGEGV